VSTESYDVAKLVVSPIQLKETYDNCTNLVEGIVHKLEDINKTLNDLQLSWIGPSSDLANQFTQRWQDAMQSLFGTQVGMPTLGAFDQLLQGVASATGNYYQAENWVMTTFGKLVDGLMGWSGSGPSGPTSVTNTGTGTEPSTFITETF